MYGVGIMHLDFKSRINVSVAILITVSLITLGSINIITLKKEMNNGLINKTTSKVEDEVSKIETWLMAKMAVIENNRKHFTPLLNEEQNLSLVRVIKDSSNLLNVFISYEDGSTFAAHGGENGVFQVSDRFKKADWYLLAKRHGKTTFTDIYFDDVTNKQIFSIVTPIYVKGQFSGVLAGDISLDYLTSVVKDIQFAGGAAELSDNNNKYIVSDDIYIGKTPSQIDPAFILIEQAFDQQKAGTVSFNYQNTDFDGYFKQIELDDDNHWTLMVFIDHDTATTQITETVIESLITGVVLLILSIMIMIVVVKNIYKPVLELKHAVSNLASGSGDLTHRLEVKGRGDLAEIGQGFNLFVSNLNDMMLQIESSTGDISQNVEKISISAQQNETVLSLHSSETEQIVTAIHEMNATANSVAESVLQSAEIAELTKQEADHSHVVVTNSVTNMSALINEVDGMAQNIQATNDDAHQISHVLSVIGSIAEQTNLLALNAAIEAARAGDQGRGFAVVADEVRALAARTQESTSEISNMLAQLLNSTTTVVAAMETTKSSCQIAATTTAEVSAGLDNINKSVVKIDDLGSQIATAAEEQSSVAEEINRNMLAIRDIVTKLVQSGQSNAKETESLFSSNLKLSQLVSQFKLR